MNVERGFRRLTVLFSLVFVALGVTADVVLHQPTWNVSVQLHDGRVALLRLNWGSSFVRDREAISKKLNELISCADGTADEVLCLSFEKEAVTLPRYETPNNMPQYGSLRELVQTPEFKAAKSEQKRAMLATADPQRFGRWHRAQQDRAMEGYGWKPDRFIPDPTITKDDFADLRVSREWSYSYVQFTAIAFGFVVLLWLGFFAVRWVIEGFR